MRQLLVFFGWMKNPGYGQVTAIQERNIRHLESIRRMLDTAAFKNDAVYPIRYKKKEIRRAVKTLTLFNFFARRNITQDQVDSAISTIKHERMTDVSLGATLTYVFKGGLLLKTTKED